MKNQSAKGAEEVSTVNFGAIEYWSKERGGALLHVRTLEMHLLAHLITVRAWIPRFLMQ